MRRRKTPKLRARPASRPSDRSNGGSVAEGRRVLKIEARAVQALVDRLDAQFDKAVDLLMRCKGKVVVSGMLNPIIECAFDGKDVERLARLLERRETLSRLIALIETKTSMQRASAQ